MDGDGNCLFKSLSHQLYGDPRHHAICRAACCDFMQHNRRQFANFVVGDFDAYVRRMRLPATWADEPELRAASEIYARPIHVYTVRDREHAMAIGEPGVAANPPLLLSYHLNSHYNSLENRDAVWHRLEYAPGEWERILASTYEPGGGSGGHL